MDYQKHYDSLINTRKNRIKNPNVYYEKHHILPKSLGGNNNSENLIILTAREHFIAHWLLWKIWKNKEMAFAFYVMQKFTINGQRKVGSSRSYAEAKEARSVYIAEFNTRTKTGVPMSEENKKIKSELFKDVPKTKEHKDNISKSLKGKVKSIEHINNISNSLKGFKWSEERNNNISFKNSGENNGRAKTVYQIDIEGKIVRKFGTSNQAFSYMKSLKKISKHVFFDIVKNNQIFENYNWTYSFS